jgi:hypothetical protein
MGEAARRAALGLRPKYTQLQQGQQVTIDLKDATQRECACGCKYFIPVVQVYTVSALVSPNGQELTAQQPVLICLDCKEPIK